MAEHLPSSAPPPPPLPVLPYATPIELTGLDLFREGKILVMRKGAALPPSCVRCNLPADVHHHRRYYWHHPALYLILLVCVLNFLIATVVYVILALVLRQKAEVNIPLCEEHEQRRKRLKAGGLGLLLLGLSLLGLAVYLGITTTPLTEDRFAATLIGGVAGLVIGAVLHTCASPLRPRRITATHAYLAGACPDYLNSLPGNTVTKIPD